MTASKTQQTFPAIRPADGPENDDPAEARKRMLDQFADRLDEHHAFAKGQFVVWKAGLKNKSRPDYGEPAIVTGVIRPRSPINPKSPPAGSPYFQEPLTLVIGVYHEEDLSSSGSTAAASSQSADDPLLPWGERAGDEGSRAPRQGGTLTPAPLPDGEGFAAA